MVLGHRHRRGWDPHRVLGPFHPEAQSLCPAQVLETNRTTPESLQLRHHIGPESQSTSYPGLRNQNGGWRAVAGVGHVHMLVAGIGQGNLIVSIGIELDVFGEVVLP